MKRATIIAAILLALVAGVGRTAIAADLPELTQPVNDFARVIDAASAGRMEQTIRALQAKTGDVVVVATVPNLEPYGDINEYAVKLFENHGRGIGQKGKDNGLLIVLAPNDRRVRIEVGYDLEQFVTDGFSGETSRMMTPFFGNGRYGEGLRLGVDRVVGRIAQGRGVTLDGVQLPQEPAPAPASQRDGTPSALSIIFWVFIAILVVSRISGGRRRRSTFWGGGPWSGWSSGVGPFGGGGWGGGGGGGGFGGGFGGFGGGRSGGGGGGASW
ncbi:MAG TPA: TPM domain-containing protein [Vicinamibacterales bacterium]|nr:TPM domain-containing protein [Vicinamibacterales bacterium]